MGSGPPSHSPASRWMFNITKTLNRHLSRYRKREKSTESVNKTGWCRNRQFTACASRKKIIFKSLCSFHLFHSSIWTFWIIFFSYFYFYLQKKVKMNVRRACLSWLAGLLACSDWHTYVISEMGVTLKIDAGLSCSILSIAGGFLYWKWN